MPFLLSRLSSYVSNIFMFRQGHIEGTHDQFRLALAKSLRVDPSQVVFFVSQERSQNGFQSNASEFGHPFYHEETPTESEGDDYERMLPASATNTEGVLERIVCRYGNGEEDYCRVLFKYKQRGLTRRSLRDAKLEAGPGGVGWYEHPIRGRLLEGPDLREVFPGRRGGDLFLNWVEYPVRCQVWRFRGVSWTPFKEAGWEALSWGFQDEGTKGFFLVITNEHTPAFVKKETFEAAYMDINPIII